MQTLEENGRKHSGGLLAGEQLLPNSAAQLKVLDKTLAVSQAYHLQFFRFIFLAILSAMVLNWPTHGGKPSEFDPGLTGF